MTATNEPAWVQRFRAISVGFPNSARDVPHRCIYVSNASGVNQVYAWDRREDTHTRLTDRDQGVFMTQVSADGEWVWWFDDDGGNEQGRWMRQPFSGIGDAEFAVTGVPGGYPIGLHLGRTRTVLGFTNDDATTVHVHRDGEAVSTIYSAASFARAAALSRNEELVAIDHTEHGDADYPAVRVIDTATGEPVADLWDGVDRGLHAVAFAPVDGDARLIVEHERSGPTGVLIWDIRTGEQSLPALDLDGDISARWYPDGQALLVKQRRHGRDRLYRYDLESSTLTGIETPAGVIGSYNIRPDGTLEYHWSSSATPGVTLDGAGRRVLESPDPPKPSVPLTDAWVDGPGGHIHALVARPHENGPAPTVVMLHGGPGGWTDDGFSATRATLVDAGYCVIHVNYRGSSGYGAAWRDADREAPGLIELEDIGAVRDWAVEAGIADPARCVIGGYSWGGYLTLLGLGIQPSKWAAGLAMVPIGDMVALYEDEMQAVREHDRALFGGTPEELPEKWARSSPITYAEQVRAPVLVVAGRNDVRCPIRQVENFLAVLDKTGAVYEADIFDAGHFSLVVDEQIRQHALQLDFLARHLPA
ncbi:S9 family peptidase [Flindersiella endophytica]